MQEGGLGLESFVITIHVVANNLLHKFQTN